MSEIFYFIRLSENGSYKNLSKGETRYSN